MFSRALGTPCDNNNIGDPVVLYDAVDDRWMITDFAWTNNDSGPYYECLAVSKTGDPVTGGWWLYALRADDATHDWLNDYPKLGVWPDGIYMSANMFDCLNALWCGHDLPRRAGMGASTATTCTAAPRCGSCCLTCSSSFSSLLPSNFRGAAPPARHAQLLRHQRLLCSCPGLWKFHVDWDSSGQFHLHRPHPVAVASLTTRPDRAGGRRAATTLIHWATG